MSQYSEFSSQIAEPVLASARRIAEDQCSAFVASEHLFLAVLQTGNSTLTCAFEAQGVTTDSFEKEVQAILKHAKAENQLSGEPSLLATDVNSNSRIPEMAPKATAIVALAKQLSQSKNRVAIGTEDILLALAADENSLAFKALQNLGLDLRKFTNEYLHQ